MENWDSSVNPQRSSAKVSCQSLLVLIAEMVKDETQEEVWGKQEKDWVWQQPIGLVWNLNFNKELDGLVYVTKNIIEALNISCKVLQEEKRNDENKDEKKERKKEIWVTKKE